MRKTVTSVTPFLSENTNAMPFKGEKETGSWSYRYPLSILSLVVRSPKEGLGSGTFGDKPSDPFP